MPKSETTTFEKNIYVESRCGAYRFTVSVHPLPRDTATFSTLDEGAVWARRRRVELLEEKSRANRHHQPFGLVPRTQPQTAQPAGCPPRPNDILVRDILTLYKEVELKKLSGEMAAASRLKRLQRWFGGYTLGQLSKTFLEKWKMERLAGMLGSGRNPSRGVPPATDVTQEMLTKHQRYWRKKTGQPVAAQAVFPVASQTVRHELALLRRATQVYFETYEMDEELAQWLAAQPLMKIALPNKADFRDRRFTDDEVKDIVGQLKRKTPKAAVLFGLLTSLRRAEILSLRWEHVDFTLKVVRLMKPGHQKGTKTHQRLVPLLPGAIQVLQQLGQRKSGQIFQISRSGLSQAWRRAADRAGAADGRLHDCRREAISRMIETFELSLAEVTIFSGHQDIRTLQKHYVHLFADRISAKLEKHPNAERFVPIS